MIQYNSWKEKWEMERMAGNHIADLIGETLPGVMEQLIREYPPKEGDISRIMQIPSSEIIKRMKEELIKKGI